VRRAAVSVAQKQPNGNQSPSLSRNPYSAIAIGSQLPGCPTVKRAYGRGGGRSALRCRGLLKAGRINGYRTDQVAYFVRTLLDHDVRARIRFIQP